MLSDGEANGVAEGIAGRFADIAQYGAQRQDWLGLYTGIFADMAAPLGTLAGKDRPADATPRPRWTGTRASTGTTTSATPR